MPTRLTLFLLLYLCVVGQSRADEPTCVDAPSAACLSILAGQHAMGLVRSENWLAITRDLALAGRIDDAKALVGNLSDPLHRSHLEETAAVIEVAANARANPSHVASLKPILRLGNFRVSNERTLSRYDRISSSYHLLALDFLGEQPFSGGGTPWLVEAEKAHADRNRPPSNATLQVVLMAWSEIIDKTTSEWQGYRKVQLANAYSASGEFEKARGILQSLDRKESILKESLLSERILGGSLLLVRAWLRAGDPATAVAVAAQEINVERRAECLAEIASAYLSLGRKAEALNTVAFGFASLDKRLADPAMKTHSGAVKAYIALLKEQLRASDTDGATRRLEELARIAERPDMFQPFNLASVAAVFNDVKQFARSRALLERALTAVPSAERTVGLGFHGGPIRYDKSGLGGAAIQQIAVEFYRSGDSEKAVELLKQVDSTYRMRACIEVVRNQIAASDLRFDPAALAEAVEPKYASWMLLAASAFKIKAGEIGEAKALFERALKTGEPSDLLFARVAILLGEPTLVVRSLRLSLKRALAIDDADRRALHLASLAALARAVLPR